MHQWILFIFFSLALAQQPEFRISSFNLGVGETLQITANDLQPESVYALTINTPEGTVFRETPRTNAKGSLSYSRKLDREGEWSVRIQGKDINTQLFVKVTKQETASAPEGIEAGVVNPLSTPATNTQAEESTPESSSENASTPETQTSVPATNETAESSTEPILTEADQSDNSVPVITDTPVVETQAAPLEADNSETVLNEAEDTRALETSSSITQTAEPEVTESAESEAMTQIGGPETSEAEGIETETAPSAQTEEPEDLKPEANPTETSTVPLTPKPDLVSQQPANIPLTPLSDVQLENNAIRSANWTLEFPVNSGQTQGLASFNNAVYIGHGNSVLKLEPENGNILQRWIVSGQVKTIEPHTNNLSITTDLGNGLSETLTLMNDQLVDTVRFGQQTSMFQWLKHEAEVTDPVTRLNQDATNPWLYVKAASTADNSAEARIKLEQAVEKASTFYDLAGLSRVLLDTGNTDLADLAFDKALQDFATRGYDPRLLSDLNLHEAYNFPLEPFKTALREQNMEKTAFWAKWLRYFSASSPQVQAALSNYANILAKQGQRSEATLWRSYARAGGQTGLVSFVDNIMTSIGRSGWYGVIALLVSLFGLALTLLFKYWEPQSLLTRRRQVAKKPTRPWDRLWAVRHYSFTEKLFVVLLLAAILVLSALAQWSERGQRANQLTTFKGGTLASSLANHTLATLPDNPRSNFIRGYAAQVSGDIALAKTFYTQASNFAPALNNLGVLENNPERYQRALELSPGLAEARVNQGQNTEQIPFSQYTHGMALSAPNQADFQTALAGSWQHIITQMFTNPWKGLEDARPSNIPAWLWYILMALFLLLCLISIIWLFIPRPKLSRNAPRTLIYHILSLLIPGTGLADEMWGLVLLIPWALVGLDVLSGFLGWGLDIGLSLNWGLIVLGLIYLINTIAFFIELVSYRKRMTTLKQTNPDLAREFGLRVRTLSQG